MKKIISILPLFLLSLNSMAGGGQMSKEPRLDECEAKAAAELEAEGVIMTIDRHVEIQKSCLYDLCVEDATDAKISDKSSFLVDSLFIELTDEEKQVIEASCAATHLDE